MHRIYVEKRPEYAQEAASLCAELKLLCINGFERARVLNRYDVEGLDDGSFERCAAEVFSDPCVDELMYALPDDGARVLAVEYLPGQYDQRADSAEQCVRLLNEEEETENA